MCQIHFPVALVWVRLEIDLSGGNIQPFQHSQTMFLGKLLHTKIPAFKDIRKAAKQHTNLKLRLSLQPLFASCVHLHYNEAFIWSHAISAQDPGLSAQKVGCSVNERLFNILFSFH